MILLILLLGLGGCASPRGRETACVVCSGPSPAVGTLVDAPVRDTFRLRILSLNVWGLPEWMNGAHPERYARIRAGIEESQADVVVLQEVWTLRAHEAVPMTAGWSSAAAHDQDRFVRRNGLVTASRLRILGAEFHPFTSSRIPDAFVRKGALKVTLELRGGMLANLWNVHLQAGGASGTRLAQIDELSRWVRDARDGQAIDIVAGDFNSPLGSPGFQKLLDVIGPTTQQIAGEPYFVTYDACRPGASRGETLDYVFVRLRSPLARLGAHTEDAFAAPSSLERCSDHIGLAASIDGSGLSVAGGVSADVRAVLAYQRGGGPAPVSNARTRTGIAPIGAPGSFWGKGVLEDPPLAGP